MLCHVPRVMQAALELAKAADVVVLALGTDKTIEHEGELPGTHGHEETGGVCGWGRGGARGRGLARRRGLAVQTTVRTSTPHTCATNSPDSACPVCLNVQKGRA